MTIHCTHPGCSKSEVVKVTITGFTLVDNPSGDGLTFEPMGSHTPMPEGWMKNKDGSWACSKEHMKPD